MGHSRQLRVDLTATGGATPSYNIKPTLDHELWEITNIWVDTDGGGSVALIKSNGTNTLTIETRTTDGAYANMPLFSTMEGYLTVTNGDTAAAVVWVDMIVHNKNNVGR